MSQIYHLTGQRVSRVVQSLPNISKWKTKAKCVGGGSLN